MCANLRIIITIFINKPNHRHALDTHRSHPFRKTDHASGGHIHLKVGIGNLGDGGDIELWSGGTDARNGNARAPLYPRGGDIKLRTGYSTKAHSGDFDLKVSIILFLIKYDACA